MSLAPMGSPMTKRNDVSVKIDLQVVAEAKIAAAVQGKTLAEYLSDAAEAMNREVLAAFKASSAATPKRKPKPKDPK